MTSSEDDAYIPGLSAPGNKRPGRVKGRKPKEVHAKVPIEQPVIENIRPDFSHSDIPPSGRVKKPLKGNLKTGSSFTSREKSKLSDGDDSGMSTTFESFAEKSIRRLQKASLKDLRPEDKQRVANLIKELARVGDEKEQVVKELHGEREQYERQLMVMVEQQEKILQEREDIQEKLFNCQKLLTEYQAQLLNKQDRLNSSIHDIKEDYPGAGRQSRSREPANRHLTNRNIVDDHVINQESADESVSDLLLNPMDTVKRPYTSLIDKEIARERSLSRGSRASDYSRSRSVSPSEGRPKFAYPQKLTGPLQEPLASSTQKSMEIRALNYENDSIRSRSSLKNQELGSKGHQYSKGGYIRDQSPASSDSAKNRVVFNGKDEYDDDAEKHSPNIKSPTKAFSDPEYGKYYKKLSPGGRKRELLKQRQALLDEQERLRLVLEKQELQLQTRKYEYDKRKELQEQRMKFYKEGGKFPALKLEFDNGSERGGNIDDVDDDDDSVVGKASGKALVRRDQASEVEMYSPRNEINIVIRRTRSIMSKSGCHDDEVQVKSRVSMGTSPIATPPRSNKVNTATSPSRSVDTADSDVPRLVDVATSISYRTPLKDASNHLQGNLPLGCNRQRSSPSGKQWREMEPEVNVRKPGEKTLNVLEIVNSMDEEPPLTSSYDDLENRPNKLFTPNKYITHGKGAQSSPYRQYTSPAQRKNQANTRTSQVQQKTSLGNKLLSEEEESLEESKILEDIFFL
ncbi:protein hinderin-like isoform X4 [Ruditapes philippinarum]|uniref:protein hinderin-like isoform X4 n=1 Tax=Ruditapes philippinarum TaxID=129788 RepID=UPI00295AB1F0|nr:protein hinderin-like isoform X4 [Ruditapes philippinarum]